MTVFKNIRNIRIIQDNPRKYLCDLDLKLPNQAEKTIEYCADSIDKQGICPQVFQAIEAMEDKSGFVSEAQHKANIQQAMENRPYYEKRIEAYPKIGEQLDMLWHAMDNGVLTKAEPFYSEIKAVKETYPKEED